MLVSVELSKVMSGVKINNVIKLLSRAEPIQFHLSSDILIWFHRDQWQIITLFF